MLWLSRRPEWQRSREFETTTRTSGPGGSNPADEEWDQWDIDDAAAGEDGEGRPKTRIVFQPTADTTHTIYYRGHWLRVKRGRKQETGCEMLSIRFVFNFSLFLPRADVLMQRCCPLKHDSQAARVAGQKRVRGRSCTPDSDLFCGLPWFLEVDRLPPQTPHGEHRP
jgi:hypothetical protein